MGSDFTLALRQLRKAPGFALTAIATLAIGIGINTATFSVMDAIVLRPMAVPHLNRVVTVNEDRGRGKYLYEWVTAPNFRDWKREGHGFESLALYKQDSVSLTGAGDAAHVAAATVSPGFFDVMNIAPFEGRVFRPDEGQPGRDGEAVLSWAFWQQHFGSDASAVGRTLELNERKYTIVGVMPRGLLFPPATDVYLPLALTAQQLEDRSAHDYMGVGRLRPGVSVDQEEAEMQGIAARLAKLYPATNLGWSVRVAPLLAELNGAQTPEYMRMMMGGTLFVLLIVCANVANLQLARGLARRPEIAMRSALGAPRRRLLRQLLAENLVLALIGATGGILLAKLDLHYVVVSMPPQVARYIAGWDTIRLSGPTLAFSLLLAVGAGILAGIAPAVQALRVNLVDQLKAGSRTETGAGRSHALRNTFAVLQIALAMTLVIGASLMSKGLLATLHFADVYRPSHVLTFSVTVPESRYPDVQKQAVWYQESLDRIRALPGVRNAAITTMLPYGSGGWTDDFRIEGRPTEPGKFNSAMRLYMSDGFFPALGVSMLSGRPFTSGDAVTTQPVAIVNRKFAQLYFSGTSPLGHRVQMSAASDRPEPWVRIVGVGDNAAFWWVDQTAQPAIYLDAAQMPPLRATYVIVSDGNPLALAPAVRRALAGIDNTLPLDFVQTYEQYLHDTTIGLTYAASMLASDAGIALLLAAIGIFGVMANLVAERRREIGVRLAMGAQRQDVLNMILRRAAILTGMGIAAGVVLAVLLARSLASLLYGVRPGDPMVFAGVIATIALVALASSWLPALQAARLDPMEALREE
ncbi:MAG TPA: ABC transporter permease [Acidobacteriaceae bacterium]|nr:ABC transporter permease [Acidobacteriaceae bacterium]